MDGTASTDSSRKALSHLLWSLVGDWAPRGSNFTIFRTTRGCMPDFRGGREHPFSIASLPALRWVLCLLKTLGPRILSRVLGRVAKDTDEEVEFYKDC